MEVFGWQGSPFSAVMPKDIQPGEYILRSYRMGNGKQVNFLALYSRISNYHPPALCYQAAGQQLTELPYIRNSSPGKIRLAGLMGKRNANTILVFHGFFIDGRVIPDGIEKKLYEVKEKLINGSIHQYFLEVTVNVVDEDHAAALSLVNRFLDDMESYLLHEG